MTSGRLGMTYGLTTMTAKDVCCGGGTTCGQKSRGSSRSSSIIKER